MDAAAYRIVQEALTNVSRHAGPASALVRVIHQPDQVTVQVGDDGVGQQGAPSTSGLGLIGMRERTAALGGRLVAQDRSGGGFTVVPSCRPWGIVMRVVLVDDQPLIRTGLRALLDAEDDITVVAEGGDGRDGVRLAQEHRPDIVLMDGIEATRQVPAREELAATRVVILTDYGLDEYVFTALRAGAARLPGQRHRAGRPRTGAAGGRRGGAAPHAPGAGGGRAGGARAEQRRDRRAARGQPPDGQDPREPRDDQGACPGPGTAGGLRLRGGADAAPRVTPSRGRLGSINITPTLAGVRYQPDVRVAPPR